MALINIGRSTDETTKLLSELSGIREQILANVTLAYPLVSATGSSPLVNDRTGNAYTIVTCKSASTSYEAMVVCGPANKVFVMSDPASSQRNAMLSLLHATSGLIHLLFEQEKLPKPLARDCRTCGENGRYVKCAG